ncbi:MAG: hypothetical protein NT004_06315 [Bacteroidetes bacterium]|nr:hypothetical protein [Bacteroidota bacterium]
MKETIKTVNLNRSASIRGKVMALARYSEQQMNTMMFDFAIAYLQDMNMGEEWLAIWSKETLFWGWWRQQWTLVDEVYWYKYAGNQGRENIENELRSRYEKLHQSIDRFPDNIVYEKIHASYEVASGEILKKITGKNRVY